MKWSVVILVFVLFACAEDKATKPTDTPTKTESQPEERVERNRAEENEAIIAVAKALEKKRENSLDSIKTVVRNWNIAINVGGFATFEEVYAEDVQFYLKSLSKKEVIESKRAWILKNTDYTQSVDIRQVQYPTMHRGLTRVVFDKIIKHEGTIDTVLSILEMRYIDGEYLITKESDQITEIRIAKSKRGSQLSDGEYHFDNHRWVDTRDHDVLAHDFVPYYTTIHITIGDTLEVDMSYYSGSLREIIPYKVRNINYDKSNCLLTFEAAMNPGGWDEDIPSRLPKDEDYSSFKFQTHSDFITLLESEYPHKDMEGTHFWTVK